MLRGTSSWREGEPGLQLWAGSHWEGYPLLRVTTAKDQTCRCLSVQETEARINNLGQEGCLFLQAARDFSVTRRNGDSGLFCTTILHPSLI